MAVVIRMKRTGRRNRPCYRISVADKRFPRDGRVLDTLGLYDPVSPNKDAQITLDVERARKWISQGALPSETVHSLFKGHGVYEGPLVKPKRDRSGRKTKTQKGERRKARREENEKRKTERREARIAERRAAAKAAAAAEASEGAE